MGNTAPGGVPLAGARSGPAPSADALAAAVREVMRGELTARERDALAAFVLAWAAQWPRSYARAFGKSAVAAASWAESAIADTGRYLKLRRIAIENLSGVL